MKDVFDLILNESLDDFMNYYKVVDDKEVYSNGTEFVPIFRVKQWYEYNNKDKEIKKTEISYYRQQELLEKLKEFKEIPELIEQVERLESMLKNDLIIYM